MDVAAWLRSLGLEQYAAAFRDNGVDASVLPSLTADDLKDIGVTAVGHRRKMLDAIADLRGEIGEPPQKVAVSSAEPVRAPASAEPAGAERRQLTVLFCDLAGSTALSSQLDPEDLRDVMAAYHRSVSGAVQRQGGYVAKFLGDGVLAYFGWPQAHEDDAERAIWAGLAATEAVSKLRAGAEPLAARVGIATGSVVVGEIIGEGAARERGVVGETPNLAARLQEGAGPGAVVADAATRRLTGALFAWADLGEAALKGVAAPMRAWRALGESGVESRFEALRAGHAAPLIGREEELELLLRRWRRAREGQGQVVLLRGEAGIGKSRLTAALQEALASDVREELILYCSPQHTDSPLHPVAARLERAAGLAAGDAPEERLAKLEALLAPLEPPPEDVWLIAELLSLPTLGRWPALELSPRRQRERLLAALRRRIRSLAARRPVLAVVEDAHWADPTTRELLDLLVAEAPGLGLLLVVTQRPEFDASAWIGRPQVSLLQLNRLGREEHAALLRRIAGKPLPAEVEAEILSHTDGVPLFVEEVTRAVLESGLLREEAECWVLDGPLPPLAVPASLQASLVARLDRFSSVREVAQAGAVLGREFAHDLLSEVTGLPEAALREAIGGLMAADLLQRRGEPPEALYTFRHALIQDAAHGTLLRARRQELHRRAAAAIERLRPEVAEREPEILAQHQAEAGATQAAAALYLQAGKLAAARSAFREARAHLARGLALIPIIRQDEARRLEATLLIAQGDVAVADEGLGSMETGRAFGRAVELCRGTTDSALLALALRGLSTYKLHTGDPRGALLVLEEAAGRVRRLGFQDARFWSSLGVAYFVLGRHNDARPTLEEAVNIPGAYEARGAEISGGSVAQAFLTRLLAVVGALEQSATCAADAIERTRQAGHLPSLGNTLTGCSAQAWLLRDVHALGERSLALSQLAEAQGFPYFATRALDMAGWVAVEQGKTAEGIGLITDSLERLHRAGNVLHTPQIEAMLSDAYLRGGDAAAALQHVEEALRIATQTGETWLAAELHRRKAGVLLLLNPGDQASAETEFRRALEIARSQLALLFELRAARDLARLWHNRDRTAEARQLLAPVYAAFTEGFGFADLLEAKALLDELNEASARADGG